MSERPTYSRYYRDGEITYFVNKPYAVNKHAQFLYGEGYKKVLEPCKPIENMDMCIGRIDNPYLNPKRFMIRDEDRSVIRVEVLATQETLDLTYPGKSAFVLLQPDACYEMFIKDTIPQAFGRETNKRDSVHTTTVEKIYEAGWIPYSAPLQLNGLFDHVRVVFNGSIPTDDNPGEDPTEEDAKRLQSVFTLIPNLRK